VYDAPVNVTANCVCVTVDACIWYMYDYDIHVCALNVCLSKYDVR
jgi:streptogramin lyase